MSKPCDILAVLISIDDLTPFATTWNKQKNACRKPDALRHQVQIRTPIACGGKCWSWCFSVFTCLILGGSGELQIANLWGDVLKGLAEDNKEMR